MLKETILFVVVCLLFPCSAKKKNDTLTTTKYPELYRDHVYDSLSEKGKDMFYATSIHPSCVEKKGLCMPRTKCFGTHVLYISRICYKRDFVCCYDNTIKFPVVPHKSYNATPSDAENTTTTTEYIDPTPLP